MVATAAPEVFTDWKRQSAELHIARLFQVNMQKLCHQAARNFLKNRNRWEVALFTLNYS